MVRDFHIFMTKTDSAQPEATTTRLDGSPEAGLLSSKAKV